MQIHNTYEERSTNIMLVKPITDLARLIGRKWFLTLEELSKRSGVGYSMLVRILHGQQVGEITEKKLRDFLDNYKGEQ